MDRRLRRAVPPDADAARERAWAVVEQAPVASVAARRSRRRHTLAPVLTALALAACGGTALALTGQADDAADWLKARVDSGPAVQHVQPLPAPGRLLVRRAGELSVVRGDGTHARVPLKTAGAAWSPHGLFIATWLGHELRAVEPDGDPRWRITAPGTVSTATWSSDGFRIAYLAGAARLRVVNGDGTDDRALTGGAVQNVRPVWLTGHRLAFATLSGRVVVIDADTGARRFTSARVLPDRLAGLTGDGRFVTGYSALARVTVDTKTGTSRRTSWADGMRFGGVVAGPGGLASLTFGRGHSTLNVDGRDVLSVSGTLRNPTFSPDGRAIAVANPDARQVIVVRLGRTPILSTVQADELLGWAEAKHEAP